MSFRHRSQKQNTPSPFHTCSYHSLQYANLISVMLTGAEPMDKINPGKVKSHEGGSRLVLERELLRCEKRELNPNSILDLEAVSGVLGSVGVPDRHLRTLYGDLFRRGVRDLNKVWLPGVSGYHVCIDNHTKSESKTMCVMSAF